MRSTYDKISRMWEQHEIVLLLKAYTQRIDIEVKDRYILTTRGIPRVAFVRWTYKRWYGSDVEEVDDTNFSGWQRIRSVLDECVEDGYVIQKENQEDLGLSLLKLSSKGWKLARWQYFYFKYLPEEFGNLKLVLGTVVVTILTSSLLRAIYHWLVASIVEHTPL